MTLFCQLKFGPGCWECRERWERLEGSRSRPLQSERTPLAIGFGTFRRVVNGRLPRTAPGFIPRLRDSVQTPHPLLSRVKVLGFGRALSCSREPPVYGPSKRSEPNNQETADRLQRA
jgi:hypothetical protein